MIRKEKIERLARMVGSVLGSVMILGMVLVLGDEAVRLYRGWRNTNGSLVPGYGLYEKHLSSPLVEKALQEMKFPFPSKKGWELIEFYQWRVSCRLYAALKQRPWGRERKRLLAERGGFQMVLPKDVLSDIWSSTAPELSPDDPLRIVLYGKEVEKRFGPLPEGPPLYTEADLPIERYRCVPMKMLYQSGRGWGFF